jgi:hypothetical protein
MECVVLETASGVVTMFVGSDAAAPERMTTAANLASEPLKPLIV